MYIRPAAFYESKFYENIYTSFLDMIESIDKFLKSSNKSYISFYNLLQKNRKISIINIKFLNKFLLLRYHSKN